MGSSRNLIDICHRPVWCAGTGEVSVEGHTEFHRLQHELELLRLKDLQQEHHIQVLTQQLKSSQAKPEAQAQQVKTLPYACLRRVSLTSVSPVQHK